MGCKAERSAAALPSSSVISHALTVEQLTAACILTAMHCATAYDRDLTRKLCPIQLSCADLVEHCTTFAREACGPTGAQSPVAPVGSDGRAATLTTMASPQAVVGKRASASPCCSEVQGGPVAPALAAGSTAPRRSLEARAGLGAPALAELGPVPRRSSDDRTGFKRPAFAAGAPAPWHIPGDDATDLLGRAGLGVKATRGRASRDIGTHLAASAGLGALAAWERDKAFQQVDTTLRARASKGHLKARATSVGATTLLREDVPRGVEPRPSTTSFATASRAANAVCAGLIYYSTFYVFHYVAAHLCIEHFAFKHVHNKPRHSRHAQIFRNSS